MVEGAKIYLPRCSLEHIQDRGEAQAGLTRHQRRCACYAGVWAETRLGAVGKTQHACTPQLSRELSKAPRPPSVPVVDKRQRTYTVHNLHQSRQTFERTGCLSEVRNLSNPQVSTGRWPDTNMGRLNSDGARYHRMPLYVCWARIDGARQHVLVRNSPFQIVKAGAS